MPRNFASECDHLLAAKNRKIEDLHGQLQRAIAESMRLEALVEDLECQLSRLPMTADGVTKFCDSGEDMLVYAPDGAHGVISLNHETGWVVWPADENSPGESHWPLGVGQCFSSPEAAKKQREST